MGDSFTSGVPQTGGIGPAGWPAVLGRQTGWRVTTHALPGAGFLSPGLGKDGRPFEGPTFVELAKQVGPSDLVLVFGSLNDLDFLDDPGAAGPYASAVRAVMASVRAKAPRVVVATTFVVGSPTAELRAMGDLLRRLSRGSCTDFLDPLAEGWLRDGHGIGSDGEHPDDSGHVTLAGLWLDDLSRLGIARSLP